MRKRIPVSDILKILESTTKINNNSTKIEESKVEFNKSPPKDNIDVNIIDINDYKLDINTERFRLIQDIVVYKKYFNPKSYTYDPETRTIGKVYDPLIKLQLNINMINVDIRWVLLILAVMELNLIGLIGDVRFKNIIKFLCRNVNFQYRYRYTRRRAILSFWKQNHLVSRVTLVISDEEFDSTISDVTNFINWEFISNKEFDSS